MMAKGSCEMLVIGGSAGSLSVVLKIIPFLTKTMDVAVIIIFHRKNSEDNDLITLLAGRTTMNVMEPEDKEAIVPGTIYIAPPDYHLLIEKGKTISLDDSEKVNYCRPSIDVTIKSAAEVYNKKMACIILSGANADGIEGLAFAHKLGATIIVQDPATAEVAYMPLQAVEQVPIDLMLDDNNLEDLLTLLM